MTKDIVALERENNILRQRVADLSERVKLLEEQLRYAQELPHMGLMDSEEFKHFVQQSIRSAERFARFLSVGIMDQNRLPLDTALASPRNLDLAVRVRTALRESDVVSLYPTGEIYVLLEETEIHQAYQAFRRIQPEIENGNPMRFALACYPIDTHQDNQLFGLLNQRMGELTVGLTDISRVNLGGKVLELSN